MEEMKNLVIQSLETRGVLGQIRAKLRSSVFKIVDEQDQKFNMGCGLKWENPSLYKISDTKCGTLVAELMREFMEFFKMDYSLSVFIPECSISPERLKREEIFAKLGLKSNSVISEFPMLYFILHYFCESLIIHPEKVYDSINNSRILLFINLVHDIEKTTDEIIENNLRNYYAFQNNQNEQEEIQNQAEENTSPDKYEEDV